MAWTNILPADCPPADARGADQVVFRLVRADPPDASDFVSFFDRSPLENWGARLCQAMGLSVYESLETCRRAARRSRSLRNRLPASADLAPHHGMLARTDTRNPGHLTWWLSAEVGEPAAMFSVVPLD